MNSRLQFGYIIRLIRGSRGSGHVPLCNSIKICLGSNSLYTLLNHEYILLNSHPSQSIFNISMRFPVCPSFSIISEIFNTFYPITKLRYCRCSKRRDTPHGRNLTLLGFFFGIIVWSKVNISQFYQMVYSKDSSNSQSLLLPIEYMIQSVRGLWSSGKQTNFPPSPVDPTLCIFGQWVSAGQFFLYQICGGLKNWPIFDCSWRPRLQILEDTIQ
jgi:hypothetical protein